MKSYDDMNSAHNMIPTGNEHLGCGLLVMDTRSTRDYGRDTFFILYKIESLQKYKKYTQVVKSLRGCGHT